MDKPAIIQAKSDGSTTTASFQISSITDPQVVAALAAEIHRIVAQERPGILIFDFQRVTFFTSQVLGLLLRARCQVQSYGGKVLLKGLAKDLARVFMVTGLDRFFEFVGSDQNVESDRS